MTDRIERIIRLVGTQLEREAGTRKTKPKRVDTMKCSAAELPVLPKDLLAEVDPSEKKAKFALVFDDGPQRGTARTREIIYLADSLSALQKATLARPDFRHSRKLYSIMRIA